MAEFSHLSSLPYRLRFTDNFQPFFAGFRPVFQPLIGWEGGVGVAQMCWCRSSVPSGRGASHVMNQMNNIFV